MDGINVVGVQFRRAGRIYDFATGSHELRVGDDVVVDTDRGQSLAKVATINFKDRSKYKEKGIKSIIRVATTKDMEDSRKLTPEECVSYARNKVEELKLKMIVLQAEVQFGGNKVTVFFSAPGRVDFRDLVKELAKGLKSRVELKQVGARDEAKLVGGIGICGREYCCSSFLRDFVPVSIKMAKNQNLALNPTKVSGGCGRLLCCLTYENDLYTEMRKEIPKKGKRVHILEENVYGHVIKGDVLNQKILVKLDEGRYTDVHLSETEIVDDSAGRDSSPPRESGSSQRPSEPAPQDTSEAEIWAEGLDMEALSGEGPSSSKAQPKETESASNDAGKEVSAQGQKSDSADKKNHQRKRGRRNRNRKPKPSGS